MAKETAEYNNKYAAPQPHSPRKRAEALRKTDEAVAAIAAKVKARVAEWVKRCSKYLDDDECNELVQIFERRCGQGFGRW